MQKTFAFSQKKKKQIRFINTQTNVVLDFEPNVDMEHISVSE
jgi:hypothetical protein